MTMPAQKPGRSKQDYATPPEFIDAVKALLHIESFGWDFAASKENSQAGVYYHSIADDALDSEWCGCLTVDEWGWLNPPYTDIAPWAKKCLESGEQIAFLVPASVGANWFRDYIFGQYGVTVLYLNGRISFDGIAPYPKDCMLVLFGTDRAFESKVWKWR